MGCSQKWNHAKILYSIAVAKQRRSYDETMVPDVPFVPNVWNPVGGANDVSMYFVRVTMFN